MSVVALNFPELKTYFEPQQDVSSASQEITITADAETFPRWNHFPITVYIETYSSAYTQDFLTAMDDWTSATNGLIQFSQTSSRDADITVQWVSTLRIDSKDATGDARLVYTDTGKYRVIKNAEIEFLTRHRGSELADVDMTNIAVHEIGHALGLEHSDSPDDIMYPTLEIPSQSVRQISTSYSEFLHTIYQTESKPDLAFLGKINATKTSVSLLLQKQYYFNVSFVVRNLGISESPPTTVNIFADGTLVNEQSVPKIEPGVSYSIFLGNIQSPKDFDSLEITIDPDNSISELDEENNSAVIGL